MSKYPAPKIVNRIKSIWADDIGVNSVRLGIGAAYQF